MYSTAQTGNSRVDCRLKRQDNEITKYVLVSTVHYVPLLFLPRQCIEFNVPLHFPPKNALNSMFHSTSRQINASNSISGCAYMHMVPIGTELIPLAHTKSTDSHVGKKIRLREFHLPPLIGYGTVQIGTNEIILAIVISRWQSYSYRVLFGSFSFFELKFFYITYTVLIGTQVGYGSVRYGMSWVRIGTIFGYGLVQKTNIGCGSVPYLGYGSVGRYCLGYRLVPHENLKVQRRKRN